MNHPDYYDNYQNLNQQNQPDPELEKRARELQTLGISSIILSILCMCCFAFAGIIAGIAGLIKANQLQDYFGMLSPQGQQNFHAGKICSVIGIALGWIFCVIDFIIFHD